MTRPADDYTIDIDELYPRDADHRYRLYGRKGDQLDVLAVAADPGGLGQAIVSLHDDMKEQGGELGDLGAFGILDAVIGEWIVKPWHRPQPRVTVGHLPKEVQA